MSSRVRVVRVGHVRPEQTTGRPLMAASDAGDDHIVKLSFYDSMFVSLMPIRRLFFYEDPGLPPFPSLVRSLQSSLAATLAVFLPLAGKLTYRAALSDVVVDYSPAAVSPGVKFVEAEYMDDRGVVDMHRLASDPEHHVEAFMELAPELEAGHLPAPVLAIQVTRPAGNKDDDDDDDAVGAVVVGVSMHHAVADGQSLWQFMKAWSAAARLGSPAAAPGLLPPTFDRKLIQHPRGEELASTFLRMFSPTLPVVKPLRVAADVVKGMRIRTFFLRADQIQSLKRRLSPRDAAAGEPPREAPVTAYVAITSLVWTSVVRAKPLDPADDAYLMITADCRRRLSPQVDQGYFGNCVTACYVRATVRELWGGGGDDDDDGLARAAAAIRAAIRELLDDPLPLADVEGRLQFHLGIPPGRMTEVGSSHRFMAYETDFGWGAPSRVELASPFGHEQVMLLGAADGGVQVTVALDEALMEAFAANFRRLAAGAVNWNDVAISQIG